MSLGFWADSVKNALGQPIAQCLIAILNGELSAVNTTTQPGTPLASIFSDPDGVNPLANPMMTDGLGNFQFWAAAGNYVVQIYGPGIANTQFLQPISIGGGGGGGGGTGVSAVQPYASSQTISFPASQNVFSPCTGGGSGIALALPSASGLAGQTITLIMIDAVSSVTITGAASGTVVLSNQFQIVTFTSNGTNWYAGNP